MLVLHQGRARGFTCGCPTCAVKWVQPSSSSSCLLPPQLPGLGRKLRFPMNPEDLDSRPFLGYPSLCGRGTLLLVPCRHLPAAEGCFRAADTPGTAEGPTRVPVGLCWRRQLASQKSLPKSPAPALCWWFRGGARGAQPPLPGAVQGRGVPATATTCPCAGTPQATKTHIVVTAAGRGVTGTPGSF